MVERSGEESCGTGWDLAVERTRPRWQNFSPAHHMRWERKPDLGFIKRNWDKRGLMECQKLLSREAWEEVGIKGRLVSLRTAVSRSGCIVREVKKRNFTKMCNFSRFFFNICLTWAWGALGKLGCRSFSPSSGVRRTSFRLLVPEWLC